MTSTNWVKLNRGISRYQHQIKKKILIFKLLKNNDSELSKKNLLQLLLNAEASLTEKEKEIGITELNKKLTIDVNINLRIFSLVYYLACCFNK